MKTRTLKTLRLVTVCIGLVPFLAWPGSASSQSSFSSILYTTNHDRYQARFSYSRARFFSEDGRNYWFRTFGCEFEVQYPFQGRPMERLVYNVLDSIFRHDMPSRGMRLELTARLVNGRTVQMGAFRPADISCETAHTFSLLAIIHNSSAGPNDAKALAVLLQAPYESTEQGDMPMLDSDRGGYMFAMNEDFFTPGQTARAWGVAGAITLAIIKAWIGGDSQ